VIVDDKTITAPITSNNDIALKFANDQAVASFYHYTNDLFVEYKTGPPAVSRQTEVHTLDGRASVLSTRTGAGESEAAQTGVFRTIRALSGQGRLSQILMLWTAPPPALRCHRSGCC
jgi:hypothetical protein